MAARGITVADVQDALKQENIELPGGEIRNNTMTMAVQIARLYHSAEDFRTLPVKTATNGQSIYLADIADVEVGPRTKTAPISATAARAWGLASVAQSTANPWRWPRASRRSSWRCSASLPEGAIFEVDYDSTIFIKQAIDEGTRDTRHLRPAGGRRALSLPRAGAHHLIPAITVPVSLISAFIGARYLGFSINSLPCWPSSSPSAWWWMTPSWWWRTSTTTRNGASPLMAAWHGTREVGFAVIATTAVLVMVFSPRLHGCRHGGAPLHRVRHPASLAVLFSPVALTPDPGHGLPADACRGQTQRLPDRHSTRDLAGRRERYRCVLGGRAAPRRLMPLGAAALPGGIGAPFAAAASLTPTE